MKLLVRCYLKPSRDLTRPKSFFISLICKLNRSMFIILNKDSCNKKQNSIAPQPSLVTLFKCYKKADIYHISYQFSISYNGFIIIATKVVPFVIQI